MWFFYVLRCADGNLYSSVTQNILKALSRHRSNKGSLKIRGKGPFKLIWQKKYSTRVEAQRINRRFKTSKDQALFLASLVGVHILLLRKPHRETGPSILFVPGYLTGDSKGTGENIRDWIEPLKSFASSREMGLYCLLWDSGSTSELALMTTLKAMGKVILLGSGSLLADGIKTIISTWKIGQNHYRSKQELSDRISSKPLAWMSYFLRPVYLVGHSLGARLILRAAMNLEDEYISGLIALAPPIKRKDVNLMAVSRAVKHSAVICYSKNDKILRHLFPGKALGNKGIDFSWGKVKGLDISTFKSKNIGHCDYHKVVEPLLRKIISENRRAKAPGV